MLRLSQAVAAAAGPGASPGSARAEPARSRFFGACALLCAGAVMATVSLCRDMAEMGELPMAGGWSMSSAWTPLCGGSWPAAAASFLLMWLAMTLAMMLPALSPELWRYRLAAAGGRLARPDLAAALAGLGYLTAWMALGACIFAAGAALAQAASAWPGFASRVPLLTGFTVLAAGLVQAGRWKAARLRCCRAACWRPAGAASAFGEGLRHGAHCCLSCSALTTVLLIGGAMDLRSMAVIGAAIAAERLAPAGERIAGAVGGILAGAGVLLALLALRPA
jgi:predicted metal-binding membrane protein